MKPYAVSIIVPIYNVEKYIAKCATTLFEQDFDSIEYVFVNDCTPDNSMQVLQSVIEKYPNRKNDIKIINKPQNEGLGQARKTGFESATGEYILHIDSDDWVELDMASSLYKKAKEDDADIVCCDYFINYENKEIHHKENYEKAQINWLKAVLIDIIHSYVWNKMCRRSLYQNTTFPKFSYLEDCFISTQLFYFAKKISFIHKPLCHYRKFNASSLTCNNYSEKLSNDLKQLSISMNNFFINHNVDNEYKEYFYERILVPIILAIKGNLNKKVNFICPEANHIKYIFKNDSLSFITKLILATAFFKMDFIPVFFKNIYKKLKGFK
ncbi:MULTISPECIES: glycosyltransferase family 2 protein [unclassified Campylobacter]|uniref:glycosyltransferase family 2 protein n=1 Tax=unclassified Campylobacter TaxID=2593542 RepID=UPI0022E9B18F|nr:MULTISPECIES: glycosyltransferase family 2 protein [unclassified Campylobacter]MDA3055411.1 glycosyltransferase [Campylobacter sp. CN_NA1]MDA3064899.1 glycosyltransferase [Campylobacter sp. CN_NE4]MDA3068277.1 glycosyltransferase [Campylobacter sp. CN_NE3]MDA3082410.1 glycosyltransferase [Campylobacter sp. CN_EL2]MDA3084045.1 glycosyltransferase [Campylobacter sp. CN_NE1]